MEADGYYAAVLAIDDVFAQIEFDIQDILPVKRRQTFILPYIQACCKKLILIIVIQNC